MKKLTFIVLILCATAIHAADIYVDINATGANNGSNWTDAFTNLQAGFNAAAANDHVFVATGNYVGNFEINSPTEVTGGFPTGGGVQNSTSNPTILNANFSGRVLLVNGSSSDVALLKGITIQNGRLTTGIPTEQRGGGILSTSALILIESQIVQNKVLAVGVPSPLAFGGGIFVGSDLVVINSNINSNTAGSDNITVDEDTTSIGGGIYSTGYVTLVNSNVHSNSVNTFKNGDSQAQSRGGGVYAADGISLLNSTVMYNKVESFSNAGSNDGDFFLMGGGVSTGSDVQVVNSTIAGNIIAGFVQSSAPCIGFGGGIQTSSSLILENSVIWGNVLQNCPVGINSDDELAVSGTINSNQGFVKCDGVALGSIDGGSCDVDPMFGSGYRLSAGSPLIDAGDTNALPMDTHDVDGDGDVMEVHPLDSDNMKRVSGSEVDIGAYEFQQVYFIGGTVTGLLAGNSMVLTNNMTEDLSIEADGPFVFTVPVETGLIYDVTMSQSPNNPIQPCMIINEAGTVTDSDITDIAVTCEMGTDLIFRDGF